MTDLPYDPDAATAALANADPVLARVIDTHGPFTLQLRPMASPFQALARSIVYQQLAGKAAATIFGRVEACLGGPPTPDAVQATDDDALRACGLSRNKLAALRDLTAHALDGSLPDTAAMQGMTDDEIIRRCTAVRGIGPWTAQMLLMFYLGRPDVLPTADLGVRKGVQHAYGHEAMLPPRKLAEFGERWAPYRSVASWYFWRVADAV